MCCRKNDALSSLTTDGTSSLSAASARVTRLCGANTVRCPCTDSWASGSAEGPHRRLAAVASAGARVAAHPFAQVLLSAVPRVNRVCAVLCGRPPWARNPRRLRLRVCRRLRLRVCRELRLRVCRELRPRVCRRLRLRVCLGLGLGPARRRQDRQLGVAVAEQALELADRGLVEISEEDHQLARGSLRKHPPEVGRLAHPCVSHGGQHLLADAAPARWTSADDDHASPAVGHSQTSAGHVADVRRGRAVAAVAADRAQGRPDRRRGRAHRMLSRALRAGAGGTALGVRRTKRVAVAPATGEIRHAPLRGGSPQAAARHKATASSASDDQAHRAAKTTITVQPGKPRAGCWGTCSGRLAYDVG